MNEFVSKSESMKKTINAAELYRQKYSSSYLGVTKNPQHVQTSFKMHRNFGRVTPAGVCKNKSFAKNYSPTGIVIRSIGTPVELRLLFSPNNNKSLNFSGKQNVKEKFAELVKNENRSNGGSFLTAGLTSKKIKLGLLMASKKVVCRVRSRKESRKKIELRLMDTLTGWEA